MLLTSVLQEQEYHKYIYFILKQERMIELKHVYQYLLEVRRVNVAKMLQLCHQLLIYIYL